jgi:Leucine Rich Repeat
MFSLEFDPNGTIVGLLPPQKKARGFSLGDLKHFVHMKILDLREAKTETSPEQIDEFISNLKNLEEMYLTCGPDLVEIPKTIGNLTKLRVLDLRGCSNLTTLPESIGELSALESLYLSGSELDGLPESIGQLNRLTKLEVLDMEDGYQCQFTRSMKKLSKLRDIALHGMVIQLHDGLPSWNIERASFYWDDKTKSLAGLGPALRNWRNLKSLHIDAKFTKKACAFPIAQPFAEQRRLEDLCIESVANIDWNPVPRCLQRHPTSPFGDVPAQFEVLGNRSILRQR